MTDTPSPSPYRDDRDVQVTFAGTYVHDDGDWLRARHGLDAPPPRARRRWLRRPGARTSVVAVSILAAAATSLVAAPTMQTIADELRSVPAPLLAGPVDLPDGGAEALYEAAGPSVVTLLTADGSSGTGFVYRPGLLLTNWHVVASSPEAAAALAGDDGLTVRVIASDGRERTGTVRAVDPRLDLALVDVDGLDDLPPLPLGDPDGLEVGQPVALIGSPFGIPNTMTRGVITGVQVNTAFATSTVQNGLLMTDAAANPGNSGGPLLTADGTVVGVVTLRPDESGGRTVQGLTFALPADMVAWAAGWLERGDRPDYGIIGVSGSTATPDHGVGGVLVAQVTDGMPAAEAGVRPGDVITAAGGQDVDSFDDLVDLLRTVELGERVELVLSRPVPDDGDNAGEGDGEVPGLLAPDPELPREPVTVQVEVVERPDDV